MFRCPSCQQRIKHHDGNRFEVLGSGDIPLEPMAAPAEEPVTDPMIGRTLNRMKLVKLIGSGANSRVYLAEHSNLDRMLAVKLLSPRDADDPGLMPANTDEAMALARVDHPNVIEVCASGIYKGTSYIAMEYVDGKTLEEVIKEQGYLPTDDLVRISSGILAGLEAIHAEGLLHRDIKPQNILISNDGRVLLADLGLAMEMPTEDEGRSNVFQGTANFAAPELATGHFPSVRTDLYAVGGTLYKAATGRVPFPGATTQEKL